MTFANSSSLFKYLLVCAFCLLQIRGQNEYRLPKTHFPVSYEVDLKVDENAFTETGNKFTGITKIVIRVAESSDTIKLHASKNYINIIEMKLNNTVITNFEINELTEILTINLQTSYATEDILLLVISYDGTLANDMYGFYKSSYEEGAVTKYLLTTQFQATYARRAFPCFDEPEFKATFVISITYPNSKNVLSNTAETSLVKEGENLISKFQQTPVLSTYLVAFIISEFNCTLSILGSPVIHKVCSRKEIDLTTRNWAVQEGPKLLNQLNMYTALNFNIYNSKMDQVAIPDFAAGAMENWGLVTYRETALLWSAADSSNRHKQSTSTIIAHELSHMWFGDLVTTRWWSTIFLNEGFARLFQYIIVGLVHPEWEMDKQFVIEQHQLSLSLDDLLTTQALQEDAFTPSEVSARFGTISYSKGGSILRMVQNFIGEDHFQAGIRTYLKNRIFSYSEPNLLWEELNTHFHNAELNQTVSNILGNWVEKNGYPLITVTLANGEVTLSQERFLRQDKEEIPTKWFVPISYTLSNDLNNFEDSSAKVWLTPSSNVKFPIGDASWIILNNKVSGYYRVNYDPSLWHKIAHALAASNFSNVPEINRAQIADDIFNLAKVGKMSYSDAFHYLEFLQKDTSYFTWYSALNGFGYLERRVEKESDLGKSISSHIKNWMTSIYNTVGETNSTDQLYTHRLVLINTWACKLGITKCVNYAIEEFQEYRTSATRPDPNLRSVVYCNALRYGKNSSDWDFLWNGYKSTDIATEKVTILSALGCTEDENLLNRYLEYSVDSTSGIKPQDALSVFSAVYGNPNGVEVAFTFLRENYAVIQESYKSLNALGKLIEGLADRFTTKSQLDTLQEFINQLNDSDFKKSAEKALKSATANIEWVEKIGKDLASYYAQGEPDSTAGLIIPLNVIIISILALFYFK